MDFNLLEIASSFLTSGFENPSFEKIFWFGIFPFTVFFTWLEKKFRPIPRLFDLTLAAIFIVWCVAWAGRLAFIIYREGSELGNFLYATLVQWPLIAAVVEHVTRYYDALDSYLAPATSFALLVTPLFIQTALSTKKLRPKLLSSFLDFWLGASFLVLLYIAATVIYDNPVSSLLFAAIFPVINLYGFSTKLQVSKSYSTEQFLPDFKIASDTDSDDSFSDRVRGLLLVFMVTIFWFYLTVSAGVLIAFFGAIVAGLLAIVGFGALVFTFTYDKLPSPRLRRQIGKDTRASQSAAGLTLICAVVGLLLVDGPLTLNLREMDWLETIRASILFFTVVGFIYSVDGVLILFKHIVDIMIEIDPRDTKMNIMFEEGNVLSFRSANSPDKPGHANMRAYLEDLGCKALVVKETIWPVIIQQKKTVMILGPRISPYRDDSYEGFKEFVERGDVLIILTDNKDLSAKIGLLTYLGISVKPRLQPYWGAAIDHDKKNERPFLQDRHEARISVLFKPDPQDVVLIETTPLNQSQHFVGEPLVTAKRIGKGLVITVGSLDLFINENLNRHRTYRILDKLAHIADVHFKDANE